MELTLTSLLLLSALPLSSADKVIGTYIFHRHGDRTTKSYAPVSLTPLGTEQVFASGSYYRDLYVSSAATSQIQSISPTVPKLSQISVTAPIDNVLQNSAQVFLQGLYPPAGSASAETLANGTKVQSPLGGYQYIPVNAVSTASSNTNSESNEWLQAGSGCGQAIVSSNAYFASAEYLATLASTQSFYTSLLPVINTTFPSSKASFKNAYTIFDYVHVSTIHNASIPSDDLLTPSTLHQLQTRADQHEWGLAYNASEPIRAIAGSVLAGQVLQFLNATLQSQTNASAPAPALGIQFGAYASFLAFFGLASLPTVSTNFTGIVDYASSAVFELTADDAGKAYSVRFLFANGTASAANPPTAYPLFGQDKTVLPWDDFVSGIQKFAVADTASWCKACGETTGTCATALGLTGGNGNNGSATTAGQTQGKGGLSTAVGGVIGALVTLVVILGFEALVMAVAGLRVVKKKALQGGVGGAGVSQVEPKV
ncbi:histidine acid phosphatase [Coniochaeta ligniaria NRRL 30616]|uniref:Histidine acid phosphatase n=1 Tax=Coniochaeta ligniaria NRRL 30616 TaxID=1408157 RepID=A0A1J7IM63_9PEZI|nr:histidine acid phosphatase [Coniochaeta ligniaria NRRL 30616]